MKLKEYKYRINGTKFTVGVGDMVDNKVHVEVNGVPYTVEVDTEATNSVRSVSGIKKRPAPAPRTDTGERVVSKPTATPGAPEAVKSPLPGTITQILVHVGDSVRVGDTVCVLEAMKMENNVSSQRAGVVSKILVNAGDTVLEGSDLMIITEQ